MPDHLKDKADALRAEAHDLTRVTRSRIWIFRVLVALNLFALLTLTVGVQQARRASRDAAEASAGNRALLAVFADALDPKGCIAKLSIYQRDFNTWKIENDNRLIHGRTPLPAPKPPMCKIPALPKITP